MKIIWFGFHGASWLRWFGFNRDGAGQRVLDLGPIALRLDYSAKELLQGAAGVALIAAVCAALILSVAMR